MAKMLKKHCQNIFVNFIVVLSNLCNNMVFLALNSPDPSAVVEN